MELEGGTTDPGTAASGLSAAAYPGLRPDAYDDDQCGGVRRAPLDACAGIVRITAKRRHRTKNVERLCSTTEFAPCGESYCAVPLEILAAVEVALLIEMMYAPGP
jgi:hypothetical protein